MLGLTPLEQTVAGKELIELGEEKGLKKGQLVAKKQAMLQVLEARFGPLSPSVVAQINAISQIALLDELFSNALTFIALEQFEESLAENSS